MNPVTALRKNGAYIKRLNRVIKASTKSDRIKIKPSDEHREHTS